MNPHDAEEALRPLLGALWEAKHQPVVDGQHSYASMSIIIDAQQDVINECFRLLGIQHLSE